MVKIYCGDQRPIPIDYEREGTRYQCLRKGIGVGLHLDLNGRTLPQSDPNRPRLYCGDKEQLPDGYVDFATSYQCLRKGVGVGMYKQNRN